MGTHPTDRFSKASLAEQKTVLTAQRECEAAIKGIIVSWALGQSGRAAADALIAAEIIKLIGALPDYFDKRKQADGMWSSAKSWALMASPAKAALEAVSSTPGLSITPQQAAQKGAKGEIKVPYAPTVSMAESLSKELNESAKEATRALVEMAGDEPVVNRGESSVSVSAYGDAEMDVRWKHQKEKLEEALKGPYDLFRISVHVNCSKRCLPDQGKIVSKSLPPADSDMWTGQKTAKGEKIYSLTAMEARTDRYGWHNFILTGFNCRHFLTPYKDGSKTPPKPPDEEASESSEAEQEMRAMERALRKLYSEYLAANRISSVGARPIYRRWADGVSRYEAFALKHDLLPQGWRCK